MRESAERFATWVFGLALAGLLGGALFGYSVDFGFGVRLFRSASIIWGTAIGLGAGLIRAVWVDRSHGWVFAKFLISLIAWTSAGAVMGYACGHAYDDLFSESFYWILSGAAGIGTGFAVGIKLARLQPEPAAEPQADLERAIERFLAPLIAASAIGLLAGYVSGYATDRIWNVHMFQKAGLKVGAYLGAALGVWLAVRVDRANRWKALRFLLRLISQTSCGFLIGMASGFGIDLVFDLRWW